MNQKTDKFIFPEKGFYLVVDKVAETDYFLDMLKNKQDSYQEFKYIFSAFASAARSITFCLQAVMSKYPGFNEWYPQQQEKLKSSNLAKYFVELRNQVQKTGNIPITHSGFFGGQPLEIVYSYRFEFAKDLNVKDIPDGEVLQLCHNYFTEVLEIICKCYRKFDVYVDPRIIFTMRGLEKLGWSIEDLEEALGFPRGYTDIEDWPEDNRIEIRLQVLSRYGSDEELEYFLSKYKITG
ncbi:MAG: hypothetical protein KME50_02395 [Nostoc desertorum CM1-VF14]|jgi:hypothetical protein|nr:hypothetical protein [Nostoc desertorum CM1-VF14]